MKTLTREKVKKMLDGGEDFVLINVLPEESFRSGHIPKSVNIPLHDGRFEKMVREKAPDKGKKIVVHCSSFQCMASTAAAERIEKMGYMKVFDFKGGMEDWNDAGFPVEGGPGQE